MLRSNQVTYLTSKSLAASFTAAQVTCGCENLWVEFSYTGLNATDGQLVFEGSLTGAVWSAFPGLNMSLNNLSGDSGLLKSRLDGLPFIRCRYVANTNTAGSVTVVLLKVDQFTGVPFGA